MDTPETVPASEFTRNFGRYRMRAQREAIAVSSHGQITGYFVSPDEYEEFKRFRESRRSFATAELPQEKFVAIRRSRMDPRHAHLDKMLDPNSGAACRSRIRSQASSFRMPIFGTTSTGPAGKRDKRTGPASLCWPSSARPTAR
jgi:hypothetical protein